MDVFNMPVFKFLEELKDATEQIEQDKKRNQSQNNNFKSIKRGKFRYGR